MYVENKYNCIIITCIWCEIDYFQITKRRIYLNMHIGKYYRNIIIHYIYFQIKMQCCTCLWLLSSAQQTEVSYWDGVVSAFTAWPHLCFFIFSGRDNIVLINFLTWCLISIFPHLLHHITGYYSMGIYPFIFSLTCFELCLFG